MYAVYEAAKKMVSGNEFIAGVVLFGSTARGEGDESSDLDLLVLWEHLDVDPRERHIYVYKAVSKFFPGKGLTVLDMEYERFLKARKATPLLLNIIWDGIVVYDKYGKLDSFILRVREELRSKGVIRKRTGKYHYWVLPKPGQKIVLEV